MSIKNSNDTVKDNTERIAEAILRSRLHTVRGRPIEKKRSLEGGCGVIGIIGSEKLEGHCIIRPCEQIGPHSSYQKRHPSGLNLIIQSPGYHRE